jgi:aminoglycoside phosphotransferase family enzyme/predicted kinase
MATIEEDFVHAHAPERFELRETHISRVFLGAERVYKLKKPVDLGFLDFTTLERRQRYCQLEVALNRRLAPDVYLGVVPITRDASGRHVLKGTGAPVEYAVEMRRLPDRDAGDVRLREGRLGRAELERIAVHLAEFHANARRDAEIERFGTPDQIEDNVRENFEQTRDTAPHALDRRELAAIEQWQLAFLRERHALFAQRIARGRIRDGHGDLRLEHCYLSEGGRVEIIDCIEFNERFRYGDVAADVAFLAMDLNWHERHDLSEALLAHYTRASGDYDLYSVVDFYQSYRAYVRGKVSSFLEQQAKSEADREKATALARKYYLLAGACMREPLERPRLIAVGGYMASGKSTVAAQLGLQLDVPVLQNDRLRKQQQGIEPHTPQRDAAFSGNYAPERNAEAYAELIRLAEVVLASGRTVVLDASFRLRSQRTLLRELAERCGVGFMFVECVASVETCRARLATRAKGPSVSDGRLEVFDAFVSSFERVDELPTSMHLRLDTNTPLERDDPRLTLVATSGR